MGQRRPAHRWPVAVVVLTTALLYAACSGGSEAADTTLADVRASESTPTSTAKPTGEDYEAEASDFRHLSTMTPVRGFFVDNRLGHLDEAVAIAEANEGGVYPVGTIIQLVPQEAMVKRATGWSPATSDWEFFFLDVTADGVTIEERGKDQVVNRFGGNCADCHAAAEPKYDFVCEDTHGCEALPIGEDIIEAIQKADPRPR